MGHPFVVLVRAKSKNKGNRRSFDLFGAHAPNFAQDDIALGERSGFRQLLRLLCFGQVGFDDCQEFREPCGMRGPGWACDEVAVDEGIGEIEFDEGASG